MDVAGWRPRTPVIGAFGPPALAAALAHRVNAAGPEGGHLDRADPLGKEEESIGADGSAPKGEIRKSRRPQQEQLTDRSQVDRTAQAADRPRDRPEASGEGRGLLSPG